MSLTSHLNIKLFLFTVTIFVFSGTLPATSWAAGLYNNISGIKDIVRSSRNENIRHDAVYRTDDCNDWEELRQDVFFFQNVQLPLREEEAKKALKEENVDPAFLKNFGIVSWKVNGVPDSASGVIVGEKCNYWLGTAHNLFKDGKYQAEDLALSVNYPNGKTILAKKVSPLTQETISSENYNKDIALVELKEPAYKGKDCVPIPVIANAANMSRLSEDIISVGYYRKARRGETRIYDADELPGKRVSFCKRFKSGHSTHDLIDNDTGLFAHNCPVRGRASGMGLIKIIGGKPYLVGINTGIRDRIDQDKLRNPDAPEFGLKTAVHRGLSIQDEMVDWLRIIGVEVYDSESEIVPGS